MADFFRELNTTLQAEPLLGWVLGIAAALALAFGTAVTLRALSKILRKSIARFAGAKRKWTSVTLDLFDGLRVWVLAIWIFYFGTRSLIALGPFAQKSLLVALVLSTAFQVSLWGLHLIRNWNTSFLEKRVAADPSSSAAISLLFKGIQLAFLSIVVLISLSHLGIDITALVAGLGVGGIAVALAAQNVLGDLLASLSLVLDRPFVIGDFIVLGTTMGTVEQIGLKTTRLRSLSGEELVLSNKDLLESRIQNFRRMRERRVVQRFGVVYATSAEKLEAIPRWIESIIRAHPSARFDRCHFAAFGDSSLDFELVFFVLNPDYISFMDLQQKVLLDIFRKFSAEGVSFAYPTRSLILEKGSAAVV